MRSSRRSIESTCQSCGGNGLAIASRLAFTTTIRLRDTGGYSGTAGGIKYGYDESGKPIINKEPKLMLDNHGAGKPEAIHLVIGRLPIPRSAPSARRSTTQGKRMAGPSSA
jgi:hypothetical protein